MSDPDRYVPDQRDARERESIPGYARGDDGE
jgi:hypothetical protein